MHEFKEPRGNFNFWDCHTAHYPRIYWSWQYDRGRVFTCVSVLIYSFPAEQDARRLFSALGERGCQIHPRRICNARSTGGDAVLPPSRWWLSWVQGSSLQKWFLWFFLLRNAIKGSSLYCSVTVSPKVARPLIQPAHGPTALGSEPDDLLNLMNLVTPASPSDSRLPPTTGTKLFKNLLAQPREVSKQYTLQTESTRTLPQVYVIERILFLFLVLLALWALQQLRLLQ